MCGGRGRGRRLWAACGALCSLCSGLGLRFALRPPAIRHFRWSVARGLAAGPRALELTRHCSLPLTRRVRAWHIAGLGCVMRRAWLGWGFEGRRGWRSAESVSVGMHVCMAPTGRRYDVRRIGYRPARARASREAPRVKRALRKNFRVFDAVLLDALSFACSRCHGARPRGALPARRAQKRLCRGRASRARTPARARFARRRICYPGSSVAVVSAGWAWQCRQYGVACVLPTPTLVVWSAV
jgi:hypothetical protein